MMDDLNSIDNIQLTVLRINFIYFVENLSDDILLN